MRTPIERSKSAVVARHRRSAGDRYETLDADELGCALAGEQVDQQP